MKLPDLARRLVATPSLSGQEGDVVALCAAEMESLGFRVELDATGNALGVVGDGRPRLLFDAHADTVAPAPGWTRDPYAAAVEDGRLYGLGACDVKGSLAAVIHGVADAARAARLVGTVGVSVSTCEEVIEGAALACVIERFAPDAAVIVEPSRGELALAQRGRAELVLEVEGHSAHAAYPERGANAVVAAARIIGALQQRCAPRDPELGDGILVVTEIRSEPFPGVSVVPSRCRVRLDRRVLPGETVDSLLRELEPYLEHASALGARARIALSTFAVETHTGVAPAGRRFFDAWRADRDDPFIQGACAAVPVGRPAAFCTNASLTVAQDIPTVIFGAGDPELAHQPDEYVELAELERARTGFAALACLRYDPPGHGA